MSLFTTHTCYMETLTQVREVDEMCEVGIGMAILLKLFIVNSNLIIETEVHPSGLASPGPRSISPSWPWDI